MSIMSDDIDKDIDKYINIKEELALLEKKAKKYKEKIEKYMNENNVLKIDNNKSFVSRTLTIRNNISKQNVPKDIFDKYSTKTI
jgi:regulator of replication initiation timing